jgi:hypothetical protein
MLELLPRQRPRCFLTSDLDVAVALHRLISVHDELYQCLYWRLTFKVKGKEMILWKGKLHRPSLSKLVSQGEAAVRRGAWSLVGAP